MLCHVMLRYVYVVLYQRHQLCILNWKDNTYKEKCRLNSIPMKYLDVQIDSQLS